MIIDLSFLIYEVIAQFYNPTTELTIPARTPTNKAYVKIEIQTLMTETKTINCSKYLKAFHNFLYFLLIKLLCFILSENEFIVSYIFLV